MSSQAKDTGPATVVTTIRLPRGQHDQLKARAKANHRSVTGEVGHRLAESLQRDADRTQWAGDGSISDFPDAA